MSKKGPGPKTYKSVNDVGYSEFQAAAREAIEINRRKRRQLNKAATQIQRKVRKRQTKKKNKRKNAATKIANAVRKNAAINKKYNLKLEKDVGEFISEVMQTNSAKKFVAKLSAYDKHKFESCLKNCFRQFTNMQRYYTKKDSRFSIPMGQILRQISNLSDGDSNILTRELLKELSNDSNYNSSLDYTPSEISAAAPAAPAAAPSSPAAAPSPAAAAPAAAARMNISRFRKPSNDERFVTEVPLLSQTSASSFSSSDYDDLDEMSDFLPGKSRGGRRKRTKKRKRTKRRKRTKKFFGLF